jgi:ribose transport system permease protein
MKKFNISHELIILFIIIIMVIFFGTVNRDFLKITNILNITRQIAVFALVSVGQAIVIISGGFDLSVGAVVGLSGCLVAYFMGQMSVFTAIILTLVIGFSIGTITGTLVSKGKINPFLATLAMMTIIRGVLYIWTKGAPVYASIPKSFTFIGKGYIWRIPSQVIFVAVIVVILHYVLKKNIFGRYVYAIGGNIEASYISGIKVDRTRIITFGISAVLSALGGIIVTARLASGQPVGGLGYELESIAMAVIGGIALYGGEGTIPGCILGVLFMGILKNGLNLLRVSSFMQEVVTGIVIIVTVLIQNLRKNR